jgi:hypothetical protein
MKNLVLFAVLTVLGFFGLSSCSNDGNVTTPAQGVGTNSDAFSLNYTLPSDASNYFCLIEGTLDKDMSLGFSPEGNGHMPPPPPPHKGNHGKGPGHGGDKGDTTNHGGDKGDTTNHGGKGDTGKGPGADNGKGIDIGRALHQLKLTLTFDQELAVQDALKAYHECMKSVMEPIRLQRTAIIDAANIQRKAIIASYRAGEIDEATARQQLKDLNDATKVLLDAIQPDPAAGCSCLYTLLDTIGGNTATGIPSLFTTPEQQTTWDAWVATLTGICFPRP